LIGTSSGDDSDAYNTATDDSGGEGDGEPDSSYEANTPRVVVSDSSIDTGHPARHQSSEQLAAEGMLSQAHRDVQMEGAGLDTEQAAAAVSYYEQSSRPIATYAGIPSSGPKGRAGGGTGGQIFSRSSALPLRRLGGGGDDGTAEGRLRLPRKLSGVLLDAKEVLLSRETTASYEASMAETQLRKLIQAARSRAAHPDADADADAELLLGADAHRPRGSLAGTAAFLFSNLNGGGDSLAGGPAGPASGSGSGGGAGAEDWQRPSSASHRVGQPEDDHWRIPCFPSIFFTGRAKELAELDGQMRAARARGTMARQGISQHGGSGKTQLMLRFAWEHRRQFPGGIFLVQADNPSRLQASFTELAEALGAEEQIKAKATPRMVGDVVLRALMDVSGEWLICVDNANDANVLELLGHAYLPPSREIGGGHIITTSRSGDSRLWAEIGVDRPLNLPMLPLADAAICLFRCATGKWRETPKEAGVCCCYCRRRCCCCCCCCTLAR
jgi:hypothetical protein